MIIAFIFQFLLLIPILAIVLLHYVLLNLYLNGSSKDDSKFFVSVFVSYLVFAAVTYVTFLFLLPIYILFGGLLQGFSIWLNVSVDLVALLPFLIPPTFAFFVTLFFFNPDIPKNKAIAVSLSYWLGLTIVYTVLMTLLSKYFHEEDILLNLGLASFSFVCVHLIRFIFDTSYSKAILSFISITLIFLVFIFSVVVLQSYKNNFGNAYDHKGSFNKFSSIPHLVFVYPDTLEPKLVSQDRKGMYVEFKLIDLKNTTDFQEYEKEIPVLKVGTSLIGKVTSESAAPLFSSCTGKKPLFGVDSLVSKNSEDGTMQETFFDKSKDGFSSGYFHTFVKDDKCFNFVFSAPGRVLHMDDIFKIISSIEYIE